MHVSQPLLFMKYRVYEPRKIKFKCRRRNKRAACTHDTCSHATPAATLHLCAATEIKPRLLLYWAPGRGGLSSSHVSRLTVFSGGIDVMTRTINS